MLKFGNFQIRSVHFKNRNCQLFIGRRWVYAGIKKRIAIWDNQVMAKPQASLGE